MIRYTDIDLEKEKALSRDAAIQAGEAVRAFDESPAWFRLCQLLQKDKTRCHNILLDPPNRHCMSDYATASGRLQQITEFEKHFSTILEEAQTARES